MKKSSLIFPLSCICLATPAAAQQEPIDLGTIVIGARLFPEPAEDVPGSISLVFPEGITSSETADLGDVTSGVPNLIFQKTNADERLLIRGVSAFSNALADPVGVNINGVALPLGTIQAPTPIALDQAVVLVGPQGAHYGRNSEAGLISLEFASPGAEDRTSVNVTAAQDDTFAGTVYFNRLYGNTGLVFALETEQTDGAISNAVTGDPQGGERERLTGYAGLGFELDSGTTIELTHIREDEDLGKEQFRYSDGGFATERFTSNYNDRSTETRAIDVTSLRVRHDLDWADFTSITGITGFDRDFELDFDASPLSLGVTRLDLEDRMMSQEFRLSSPANADGPLKWSAGLSFYTQETDVSFDLGAFATNRDTQIEQDGAALFGFAEYAVSERLRIGAGARLDYTSSSGRQTIQSPLGTDTYDAEQNETVFLPKLTAAYDLNPDTLLYGTISRGYLAGGYNYNAANSPDNFTFDPEFTTTAELGVRRSDLNTSWDIAAFYTEVTDKQIVEVIPGGAQRINNAALVRTYGIEAKFEHRLTDAWSLNGSAGLQRATARSFSTTALGLMGSMPVDYSGNRLPYAPDVTYSLGLSYDQNDWFGSLAVNGTSAYYFDAANTLEQSAFATVDASVGWRKDNITVTLWATNLFDKEYTATALNTPRGTLVEDGAGRRIGLNVSAEW
ncbi:TonB-dependent receptor [Pseudophaeobacter sp.]|uniref:TonB-dependent receptor n=1 Tax=Pseudophaeobacter sp. TaxID=1971739 RepID=UPI00405A2B55